jgi:DNA-binding MarR family transcriptional regulator
MTEPRPSRTGEGDQQPDTAAQQSTWTQILETEIAFLVRWLEALRRRRDYPLERAPYLVLRLLERDGAQAVGVLADRLGLDGSTVTRQVATMEAAKLVVKRPHPSDARQTLIDITPTGLELAATMRVLRTERIGQLFAEWSEQDRQEFCRLVSRLNRGIAQQLARLPGQREH